MNRNSNSHFSTSPQIHVSRTKFDRPHSLKTSFNVGDIIPIFCDEILPGDTYKLRTSMVARLQTLITPMMDNLYLETYYFFVPCRLVWEHWQQFMGENTQSAWIPQVEYSVPQLEAPVGGWDVGTLADYFGIPTGVSGISVNALPFRAYALICNDWFRVESLQDPLNVPVNDTTVTGVNTGTFVSDVVKGGLPYRASKHMDYFTAALPAPQAGPAVELGLGSTAPVFGDGNGLLMQRLATGSNTAKYLYLNDANSVVLGPNFDTSGQYDMMDLVGTEQFTAEKKVGDTGRTPYATWEEYGGQGDSKIIGVAGPGSPVSNGLYADLSSAESISVNSLRVAFQVQKFYERLALSGQRYIEILKSMFGVTSPDARLQRPEYLGGSRVPINIHQVVQQSSTDNVTPQGHVAGYSVTSNTHHDFTKSFVEHGYLIGLAVVRYDHTYQQGIARMWSRRDRFDFYWPLFQNLGEQPILCKEIFAQGNDADEEVFGYQEAWADYRYKPSYVTGEMRSAAPASLDVWHLADDYNTLPTLSPGWIMEDKSNVDRVLAVTSSVSNQLFGDFFFDLTCVRRMPLYSVPGLIDHH